MASPSDNSRVTFERTESRKAISWWENHISPRNARWLSTSLKDMERNTTHMMRLIDGDEDSLARRAQMYYKRRPELITQVQEYQTLYRTLALRYEQVTVDLHRHLNELNLLTPAATDSDEEPITPRFNTDVQQLNRFRSFQRPAGFTVFLGDRSPREPSPSPSFDYDDSDFSSFHQGHINSGLPEKTIPMDTEIGNRRGTMGTPNSGLAELQLKIASYEVEIGSLKMELEGLRSSDSNSKIDEPGADMDQDAEIAQEIDAEVTQDIGAQVTQEVGAQVTQEIKEDYSDPEKVRAVTEELKLAKGRIRSIEKQNERLSTENKLAHDNIHQLKDLLKEAQTEVTALKKNLDTEVKKSSSYLEQVSRFRSTLKERDAEIKELKAGDGDKKEQLLQDEIARLTNENIRVKEELKELELQQSRPKENLSDEAEQLNADIAEKREELEALKLNYESLMSQRDELIAEVSDGDAKYALQDEIAKLKNENYRVKEELKVLKMRCHTLELQLSRSGEILSDEAEQLKALKLNYESLMNENIRVKEELKELQLPRPEEIVSDEAEQLKAEISKKREELEALKVNYESLVRGRDELKAEIGSSIELKVEVERQKELVLEVEESKREAIRQLCNSLEHYRRGYEQLREASANP